VVRADPDRVVAVEAEDPRLAEDLNRPEDLERLGVRLP